VFNSVVLGNDAFVHADFIDVAGEGSLRLMQLTLKVGKRGRRWFKRMR